MAVNRRQFHLAALGASLGMLNACGGGGGGDSTSGAGAGTSTPGAVTTYTGVASAGELVGMTLDPAGGLFGYSILESMFGLAGRVFSGPMRRAFDPLFDGAFFLDGLPDARIFSRPGLAVGVIRELFNAGTGATVPIIGFETPVTTLAGITGSYNYVGASCASPGSNCGTQHGTLAINADGTWSICRGSAPCTPLATGTLNARGAGRWQMLVGATDVGTLLGAQFVGQRLVLVDLKDTRSGGLGTGALVAAIAQPIVSDEVDGVWYFNSNGGNAGFFNLAAVVALGILTGVLTGVRFGAGEFGGSLFMNRPAPGFFEHSAGGVGLIAAPGLFVYGNGGRFEVGLRVR